MENIINKIFDNGMFSDIIMVEENPATIISTKIVKNNNEIVKTETTNIYNLETHKVKSENDIINNITENFISKIDFRWINNEINYFNRNIFVGYFTNI